MKRLICKCDRCGTEVDEKALFTVPNPAYSGNVYYPENVPFATYPRTWDLCIDCTDKLVHKLREFCNNDSE